MTESEFNAKLAERGMHVVIPRTIVSDQWGLIDLGEGVMVNRWCGGSTLKEQYAYCVREQERLAGKCKATVCSSRWPETAAKEAGKKTAKKAVKKVAKKKGGAK